jgi:cation:H+ antiporter
LFDFQGNSIWLNLLLFAGAGGVIWFAGASLQRMADAIARRTGLGQAFIGVVLLAAATSLPEVATTVTAVLIGNTSLAVHNLLGSVVFNTVVLVVADMVVGREALTHRSPRFVLLIEGLGVVFLLAIVLVGGAVGRGTEAPLRAPRWLLEIGLWEAILLATYVGVLYVTYRSQSDARWRPAVADRPESEARPRQAATEESPYKDWSSAKLYLAFAAASLVVLAAGWVLTQTGDALAKQTGLGAGFVGFVLLAVATSLPEISTTLSAVRGGHDEMAFSNIFGSSAFVLMLLALVGVMAGPEAIIQSAAPSAQFAAGLGILVTCTYLWGLLERRDRTILRMGWDSVAVLVLTLVGSAGIYLLQ